MKFTDKIRKKIDNAKSETEVKAILAEIKGGQRKQELSLMMRNSIRLQVGSRLALKVDLLSEKN